MSDIIEAILAAPVSTILVVAGLGFLYIAVVGKISGIVLGRLARIVAGMLGTVIFSIGLPEIPILKNFEFDHQSIQTWEMRQGGAKSYAVFITKPFEKKQIDEYNSNPDKCPLRTFEICYKTNQDNIDNTLLVNGPGNPKGEYNEHLNVDSCDVFSRRCYLAMYRNYTDYEARGTFKELK